MPSMKIGLFTDCTNFAGTERHMLDLACALRAGGEEAEIICPPDAILAERAAREGVPVFALSCAGKLGLLAALPKLRRAARAGRWEVLHTHNGRTTLLAALALRGGNGTTLVTTQHFVHPARTRRRGIVARISNEIHQAVGRHVDRIVAISEAVRAAAVAREAATARKIRVVLNGIRDPEADTLTDPEAVRRGLGVETGTPLVVCLSRLDAEKNLEVLIEAMRTVTAAIPQARCVIAGAGGEQANLQRRIDAAGLAGTVRLLGFHADPLSLVRAGNVFVLPSALEPFGLSIVEAMALGVPVIAVRAGGPQEIVVEGVSGLLVPPGGAAEMATAITSGLRQPDLAARLGAGGRERFLHAFTAARMATEMRAVYREARGGEQPANRRPTGEMNTISRPSVRASHDD